MQAIMYAGLRNAARDQAIAEALMFKHAKEVGQEFDLTPNAVRAAAKRITDSKVFDLKLIGGGLANGAWLCGSKLFSQGGAGYLPRLPRHIPQS